MADDELDDVFRGAGDLAGAYARTDWAATPLGPVAGWSPALRSALAVVLGTRFSATLLWGPESVLLYNSAYVELLADKHPAALGATAERIFPEIWDDIAPLLRGVLDGGGATWAEDQLLPLQRRGRLEEAVFTFSYSPVHSAGGVVEGVVDIVAEVTRQVVDRRRLELLSRLDRSLVDPVSAEEVRERGLALLLAGAADVSAAELAPAPPGAEGPDAALTDAAPTVAAAGRTVRVRVLASGPEGRDQLLVVEPAPLALVDEGYLSFLRLVAASFAQALDRVRVREVRARVVAAERAMSETLQRSLLTRPPRSEGLDIAVRYRPAGDRAQIGGDWYDAFELPDACLTLSIGDVTGHDQHAAAAMAQVRNLLRGIAFTLGEPPARVLSALDAAVQGLAVGVFATAVLAQVRDAPSGEGGPGARLLRWSNAGHLPPVLVDPDGRARPLAGAADASDLLLGLDAATERTDHTALLEPGSVVVMFTDGLVERRDQPLQDSLQELTAVLSEGPWAGADDVCEHLLERYRDAVEDDLALVVLRVDDVAIADADATADVAGAGPA